MNRTIVTAYYRATVPLGHGRVRTVDDFHVFDAFPVEGSTVTERLNALRVIARQKVAERHGISPLLVVVRDLSTDTAGEQEYQEAVR